MNYVIVTIEWCASKGLAVPSNANRSDDGRVILHHEFVKPVLTDEDDLKIYTHEEAAAITGSKEWRSGNESGM